MGSETTSMNITQSDDIRGTLDDVLNTNKGVVDNILRGRPELIPLLRQVMTESYIRGFLCGAHHRSQDTGGEEE